MKINVRGIRGKVNFGDDIGVLPLLDEDNLLDGFDYVTLKDYLGGSFSIREMVSFTKWAFPKHNKVKKYCRTERIAKLKGLRKIYPAVNDDDELLPF